VVVIPPPPPFPIFFYLQSICFIFLLLFPLLTKNDSEKDGKTTYTFSSSPGSSIVVNGMPSETLLNQEYIVANASLAGASANSIRVLLSARMNGIAAKEYAGIAGSMIGNTYVSSTTQGFRFMETDACGAQTSADNLRNSGLEPFERWQDRNDQAGASSSAGTVLSRECKQASVDRRQRIIVKGNNFARIAGAPISVTMTGKTCDCDTLLDGTSAPCRSTVNGLCSAKKDGLCSAGKI
jgi:hypothetical protein